MKSESEQIVDYIKSRICYYSGSSDFKSVQEIFNDELIVVELEKILENIDLIKDKK